MVRAVLASFLILACAAAARAADDGPLTPPAPSRAGTPTAAARVNEGWALAKKRDWAGAERAYRDAIRLDAASPEAWNGLGFALRRRAKHDESVHAYQEALRLRPAYPQALEYLGEAYVERGRLTEAREVLARLRALGAREAEELAQAIAGAAER